MLDVDEYFKLWTILSFYYILNINIYYVERNVITGGQWRWRNGVLFYRSYERLNKMRRDRQGEADGDPLKGSRLWIIVRQRVIFMNI